MNPIRLPAHNIEVHRLFINHGSFQDQMSPVESLIAIEKFYTSQPEIFCIPVFQTTQHHITNGNVLYSRISDYSHITDGNFLYSRISDFLPVSHLTGGVSFRTGRLHNETPDDSISPNFVQYRSNFRELFSSMSIC